MTITKQLIILTVITLPLSACFMAIPPASKIDAYKVSKNTYQINALAVSEKSATRGARLRAESICNSIGKKSKIIYQDTKHYDSSYHEMTSSVLHNSRDGEDYRTTINFRCFE